ncbi:hypothetical protein TUM4445_10920 [Shewanella sp. MBTL60-112-B2]|nr:hypothetical protein TUM4444_11470 [Shewanella sp. MBTL60-112-B1]GIU29057.1 hypothetical protein TUM4445_10920 [Shewanella sp. MBTL60-112-B2]
MDVPSEPLGDFYWSMRVNNFVGAAGTLYDGNRQEGEAVVSLLPECEQEAHDFGQAQPDMLNRGIVRSTVNNNVTHCPSAVLTLLAICPLSNKKWNIIQ